MAGFWARCPGFKASSCSARLRAGKWARGCWGRIASAVFLRPRTQRNSKLVKVQPRRGRRQARLSLRVPLWVSEADAPPRGDAREARGDAREANGDAREAHGDAHDARGDALEAQEETHTVSLTKTAHPWLFVPPAPIRFQWCHPELLTVPVGVPPEGRFRARIAIARVPGGGTSLKSACHLPVLLPQIFQELDRTLAAAAGFVNALSAQEAKVFGKEGQSAGMAEVNEAMCKCFDWDRHVHAVPTTDDVRAVMKVNQLLGPYLRLTEYPSQDEFPQVVHGWPDDATLATQHLVLMR